MGTNEPAKVESENVDPFEIRAIGGPANGKFVSNSPEFALTVPGPGRTRTLPELYGRIQTPMGVYTSTRGAAALRGSGVAFAEEVQVDPRLDGRVPRR